MILSTKWIQGIPIIVLLVIGIWNRVLIITIGLFQHFWIREALFIYYMSYGLSVMMSLDET